MPLPWRQMMLVRSLRAALPSEQSRQQAARPVRAFLEPPAHNKGVRRMPQSKKQRQPSSSLWIPVLIGPGAITARKS